MMSHQEFLRTAAIVAAVTLVLALIERMVPLAKRTARAEGRTRTNIALTVVVFALNWALMTAVTVALGALHLGGHGVLSALGLPMLLQIVSAIVFLDACTYVAHRLMHAVPLFWRFHRVHHSDPFVDVTTTYRFHPLEGLWRFAWTFIPALALGLPAEGILIYRVLSVFNGLFEHMNVAMPTRLDAALSTIVVTPNMHKIHHSEVRAETDSNYGNITSLFDRIFGTFTPTARAHGVTYGLGDEHPERVKSLAVLLRMPFVGALRAIAIRPAREDR